MAKCDASWEAQLAKVEVYKRRHGDCNVPCRWTEDPPLGLWVKKQRMFKKALDRGEPSKGMTAARAAKLDAIGFAWELSAAAISKQHSKGNHVNNKGWEAQSAKLKAYKRKHGDCNVPQGWAEDPRLSRWVNTQRAFKKAREAGPRRAWQGDDGGAGGEAGRARLRLGAVGKVPKAG
jgi:hypothetical protein